MRPTKLTALIISISTLISLGAQAAIPIQQAGNEKKERYLGAGVFVGGFEQGPMTLVNVRHSFAAPTRLERLVFDIAPGPNANGANRPGFFHISIQQSKGLNRIVVDLSDVQKTDVTEKQVSALLSRSHYFSGATFYKDEKNKSLTVEMSLKAKVKVEVFELSSPDKPGRIVIDAKAT